MATVRAGRRGLIGYAANSGEQSTRSLCRKACVLGYAAEENRRRQTSQAGESRFLRHTQTAKTLCFEVRPQEPATTSGLSNVKSRVFVCGRSNETLCFGVRQLVFWGTSACVLGYVRLCFGVRPLVFWGTSACV